MEVIKFQEIAGIILIPAEADGVQGLFAFDTGAMRTSLNSSYFPELQGKAQAVALFDDAVSATDALDTTLHELILGDRRIEDLPVYRMDMGYAERSLRTVEPEVRFLGSIGREVFGDVSILLDYEHSLMFVEPEIDLSVAERIPLSMEALPVITLDVEGTPRRFVLDTGANTCLISSALENEIASQLLPDSPGISVIPKMRVGTREFEDVGAVFTDISQFLRTVDVEGVIGYQILSTQLSILDFKNSALYLFPEDLSLI